jgi:hypothetical protein
MDDIDLKNLVKASKKEFKNPKDYPKQSKSYKELQIHGQIKISEHVESIYYSKEELEKGGSTK